ncbi:TAXI family TRAP transporter solute-binding subunit [Roseovarius aestuarii]|nr:TAXI family TRAP transporter solute-binding subunit [Roseovarius aestuarii]
MFKSSRFVMAAVIAGAVSAGFTPAHAGSNITLCGGSPGGLWSLLGAGIDAAVREVDPDSNVTYQTSSGGFANIVQLGQGKCDIAIVHVGEVVIAARGEEPFKKETGGVSAIALLYNWAPMQWVTDKKFAEANGIKSISDLANFDGAYNLVVNRRGILPSILAEKSLIASGLSFESIEENGGSVQFQGSKTASEIMQDGKADTWVNATFVGSGSIKSIASHRDLTLLSVSDEVVSQMQHEYGSTAVTIPAGAYEWLDHDVVTFGAQAALIAADDADPELVGLVAKAIYEHAGEVQKVHKSMGAFNPELGASITQFAYHPSATAAIEAAGN